MKDFFRLLRAVQPLWPMMWAVFALSTISTVANSIGPWVYRELVNFLSSGRLSNLWERYLPENATVITQIVFLVGFYALVLLFDDVVRIVRNFLGRIITPKTWALLREESLRRLHGLSMPFFYTHAAGAINEKIVAGGREADTIMKAILVDFWPAILRFAIAIIAIATINRTMAAALLVIMVLYAVLSVWRAKVNKMTEVQVRPLIEEQSKAMISVISNQELVRQFNGEERAEKQLSGLYRRVIDLRVSRSKVISVIAFLEEVLWKGITVLVFGYGGYLVLVAKELTLGDLVFFIAYIDQVMNPFSYLFELYDQSQSALVSVGRMMDLWDTPRDIKDVEGARPLAVKGGDIEFRNLTFYYRDTKGKKHPTAVFKDFSLSIKGGETVALIGPSGAGKSTLVKMLLRFYDPDEGAVMIDGQDIALVQQKSVRAKVATMMQDTVVFNDTVRANLKYAKPNVGSAQIDRALRLANLYDFVQKLPRKLNTLLGERGVRLSGGERQRLGIARAMLKDAPILVLDEATSSLDSQNEKQVQEGIYSLIKGKTSIIIAHRLSTVKRADRIVVLDKGRVVEQGTHGQLLKKRGYYSRLYRMQGMVKAQTFA